MTRIQSEESLSKRMQRFREERGERACPWPAYWIAEVGALEGEIMSMKSESNAQWPLPPLPQGEQIIEIDEEGKVHGDISGFRKRP